MKKIDLFINKFIAVFFLLLGVILFASNFIFDSIKNKNLKAYAVICFLYGIWKIYKSKK